MEAEILPSNRLQAARAWGATQLGGAGSSRLLALKGTFWTLVAFGGSQALRLFGTLVSTRLLFPELFGLMAIVQTVYLGLSLFSDVGLSVSIVRHPRGEERTFLDTAWTIQAVRGLLLWITCVALTPVIAQSYDDARLLWLLPLVGANAFISGFNSTSLHLLRRHLALRKLALMELVTQVLGLAVLILWAWHSPSVLALAAGGIASSIATVVGSHLLNRPQRDRLAWHREPAMELMGFGKWIFLSTALTFLASQTDRLLLGKLYTLHLLGLYNIAFSLSDMPRALLLAVSGKVIFPLLARAAETPRDELRDKIRGPRRHLLMLSALGLGLLVGFGDLLVKFLYDERYHEAAWMLPLLAAGVWPSFLSRTTDSMLFVVGRPKVPALGFGLSFAFLGLAALAGHHLAGPFGAVAGIALSSIPHYVVIAFGLHQERFWLGWQDAGTTFVFVLTAGLILGVRTLHGPYPAVLGTMNGLFS